MELVTTGVWWWSQTEQRSCSAPLPVCCCWAFIVGWGPGWPSTSVLVSHNSLLVCLIPPSGHLCLPSWSESGLHLSSKASWLGRLSSIVAHQSSESIKCFLFFQPGGWEIHLENKENYNPKKMKFTFSSRGQTIRNFFPPTWPVYMCPTSTPYYCILPTH